MKIYKIIFQELDRANCSWGQLNYYRLLIEIIVIDKLIKNKVLSGELFKLPISKFLKVTKGAYCLH